MDPIDKLSKKEALDKLKKIRDVIWPKSAVNDGERMLHCLPSHDVLDIIKETFGESLRMLPDWAMNSTGNFIVKRLRDAND